jgi:hypothetical protein
MAKETGYFDLLSTARKGIARFAYSCGILKMNRRRFFFAREEHNTSPSPKPDIPRIIRDEIDREILEDSGSVEGKGRDNTRMIDR